MIFERLKYRHELFFYGFLCIYAALGLYNLETLPVAWTDETMNLDPAIQYTKFHQYFSKLWPNSGAETVFASYPPFIQFWHILWLKFVQPTIFNVRLPFLIMHLTTFFLLYKILTQSLNKTISIFLIIIFAFDKSVFELSRSVRIEVIIMLLITLYFYLKSINTKQLYLGFIVGLIAISHLYAFPIVGVIVLKKILESSFKKSIPYLIAAILPAIFSLYFIDFNIAQLISQLTVQTAKHAPNSHNFIEFLKASFIDRFWPYYKEMPLHYFMIMGIALINIHDLTTKISTPKLWFFQKFSAELFAFSFTLFFLITPQYRYLPVFLLLGILFIRDHALWIKFTSKKYSIYILGMIALNGFAIFSARHIVAIYQRPERISEPFLSFLASNIPQNKKTLILGESIGEYYAATRKNCDYGLDFHPQHFNYNDYEQVYYLTKNKMPLGQEIGCYMPHQNEIPEYIQKFAKGGTYYKTTLWKINTLHDYQKITAPYLKY